MSSPNSRSRRLLSRLCLSVAVAAPSLACGRQTARPDAPQGSAPTPVAADGAGYRLEGEIVGIALQNINKAAGHFTWNVALEIRVARLTSRASEPRSLLGRPEELLEVRVAQSLPDAGLSAHEQAEITPRKASGRVRVSAWRGYRVGDPVDLVVELFGPALARPRDR